MKQCSKAQKDNVDDKNAWGPEVESFCKAKFHDPHFSTQDGLEIVAGFDARAAASPDVFPLTISCNLNAFTRLKRGTSSGGGSPVVANIVQRFPIMIVYYVAFCFVRRYNGFRDKLQTWQLVELL